MNERGQLRIFNEVVPDIEKERAGCISFDQGFMGRHKEVL